MWNATSFVLDLNPGHCAIPSQVDKIFDGIKKKKKIGKPKFGLPCWQDWE